MGTMISFYFSSSPFSFLKRASEEVGGEMRDKKILEHLEEMMEAGVSSVSSWY